MHIHCIHSNKQSKKSKSPLLPHHKSSVQNWPLLSVCELYPSRCFSKPHDECPFKKKVILFIRNGKMNSSNLIPKSDKYFISIAKSQYWEGRRRRKKKIMFIFIILIRSLLITESILLLIIISLRMLFGMQQMFNKKKDGSESHLRHFLSEFLLVYLGLFLHNLVK